MAGLDQVLEVPVALRVGFVVMPGGHVESGDAGLAPSRGVVIQVHAQAVRRIEEGPHAGRAEGCLDAEIAEGLEKVGKALIAAFAGRGGQPKHRTLAATKAGDHRRLAPAIHSEDLGASRQFEDGQVQGLLPDDLQGWTVDVGDAVDVRRDLARMETELAGESGGALQDQDGAVFDANGPFARCARAGP